MDKQSRNYVSTGFVLLALAVTLGAFGAHALKEHLSDHYLEVWETANKYHFIHAMGIVLIVGVYHQLFTNSQLRRLFVLMCLGLLLFSGSLYVLSLAETLNIPALKMLGAIAPIGGFLLISAWVYAAYSIIKIKQL